MKKERNRSEKKSWNLFLVLALFLCAIFGIASLTYSWLTQTTTDVPTSEGNYTIESAYIDDFSYDLEYSFNGTTWYDASTDGLGGVPVNYMDSSAGNYIGNLRYRVKQTGSVKSTVRVKFVYQWFRAETLTTANANEEASTVNRALQGPAFTLTPLNMASAWVGTNDGYYYYVDGSRYVFPQDGNYVTVCNGLSLAPNPGAFNGQLRIIALLDGVQFNRYREVWEMSSMPTTANS